MKDHKALLRHVGERRDTRLADASAGALPPFAINISGVDNQDVDWRDCISGRGGTEHRATRPAADASGQHLVRRLQAERKVLLEALGLLGVAAIIVDEQGMPRLANSAAGQLLLGGLLSCSSGRIRLCDPAADVKFKRLMRLVLRGARGEPAPDRGTVLLGEVGWRVVHVARLEPVSGHPAALVMLYNPRQPHGGLIDILAASHGLTPAETRLVHGLIAGDRIVEYACRAGITVNTVRTQLKQVFAKTGHRRQADLIRAFLTSSIQRCGEELADK